MGTEITLDVVGLTVTYSKNSRGMDHGALFQGGDRKRVRYKQLDYDYFKKHKDDLAPIEMAFVRNLKDILPRLDLLGFTAERVEQGYLLAVDAAREERKSDGDGDDAKTQDIMSFEEFCGFVAAHPIDSLDDTFDTEKTDDERKGRFIETPIIERLPLPSLYDEASYSERSYFGSLIGFLHPYLVLRLLAGNRHNLEADVVWQYGPLVENGWARETQFIPCARRPETFLIATEGSSDTHILKHAFDILKPEIADFFRFIDVTESHPFSGVGDLVRFAQGLAKIDVHNQIVFLLDNDAEGFDAWQRIQAVSLPSNMRAITLPELDDFRAFPAHGPDGVTYTDINRRAAAIECYLGWNIGTGSGPHVRWTNYKKDLELYQGALENKTIYTKAFFKQTAQSIAEGSYDATRIRAVLDALVKECSSIAEDCCSIEPLIEW
jgi:hypothetical protein